MIYSVSTDYSEILQAQMLYNLENGFYKSRILYRIFYDAVNGKLAAFGQVI